MICFEELNSPTELLPQTRRESLPDAWAVAVLGTLGLLLFHTERKYYLSCLVEDFVFFCLHVVT
jgi:hypothetical protein